MPEAGPLISVLVPIYNVENYLAECLDSLCAQTLNDFEVICINDGSTDSSRSIIQSYLDADSRFRVIDKPNSGYGASMNQGLRAARGMYVAILESDDFFEPNALEVLHTAARASRAEVAKANFWFYWSVPEPRRELFEFIDEEIAGKAVSPLDYLQIFYRKPSIWSALYRRDFLEKNRISFLETPGASYQDAAFNFKVWACANTVACVATPILSYRQDNEASSVNSPAKVFCVCDEYEEMERFLSSRIDLPRRLAAVKERMKFDTYMWNYDRLSPELRAQFVPRASAEFRRDLSVGADLSLFEPWAEASVKLLANHPDRFVRARSLEGKPGALNTVRRLLALGGLPLVFSTVARKVFRR